MNKFIPLVRGIKIGDPSEAATEMGALISLEHRAKVEYYINLATEIEGAKVECGGARPDAGVDSENGAFLLPTVLSGVSHESRVATEEIFGPVIVVIPFSSEAEAIKMANHVKYGLAASVFTQNLSRAHRVADLLESGMVWTNCWMLRDLRVPFGGSKQSGVGREGGDYSLEFYSEDKSVTIKL